MKYVLRFAVLFILFSSCKSYKTKYPYSLNDFNPELRKRLELLVRYGGVCSDYTDSAFNYLVKTATLEDLKKLMECEHPILRAKAFAAICAKTDPAKGYTLVSDFSDSNFDKEERKNSFIIDDLLLNNLDDTAIITFCAGEWGEQYTYVSDYYLDRCSDKTKILNAVLEDLVITKHNYLKHAYRFITYSKLKEKYYSIIKAMAIRNNSWTREDGYNILSKLSDFKKEEDVPFIAERLAHLHRTKVINPFSIIENNPIPAYFENLEWFYQSVKKDRYFEISYQVSEEFKNKFLSFLSAVAAYKNEQAVKIFTDAINKKVYTPSTLSDQELQVEIYEILKRNTSTVYESLIKSIAPKAIEYQKKHTFIASSGINLSESRFW